MRRTASRFTTLTFPLHGVKIVSESTDGPSVPSAVELPLATVVSMVREMRIIRELENHCKGLYEDKKVRGFLHLQEGQEAVPIGSKWAMEPCDAYSASYRVHGWHYALTGDIVGTIGEVAGSVCGAAKGKGGSMHLYAPDKGLYGGQGIVGAQVPIAAGLAFASQYLQDRPRYATVALFGDGALNQGQVAETWNMAALYRLPLIFCLEDNQYSMGTAKARGSFETSLSKRVPYIYNMCVDGMDVISVYGAMQFARQRVMAGEGPVALHVDTYRYSKHSASDPGEYRSREEVNAVKKKRDPIGSFVKSVVAINPDAQEPIKAAQKEAVEAVRNAVRRVEEAGPPPMEELVKDVYAGQQTAVRSCQSTKYL